MLMFDVGLLKVCKSINSGMLVGFRMQGLFQLRMDVLGQRVVSVIAYVLLGLVYM